MSKLHRIQPTENKGIDYKPRKFPQLILPLKDFPDAEDIEVGKKLFVELEIKVWEKQENDKSGQVSMDVLSVQEVETPEEEDKEEKDEPTEEE